MRKSGGTDVGHVALSTFSSGAHAEVAAAFRQLRDDGADALVLDLRDNPGGLLAQAVRVVSLFQADGIVCTTVGAHQPRRVFEVNGSAPFAEVPLAVLVDRGSASAAEIVAGALRDNDRATVVGRRTYGKALVQTIRELSNGEALKLTTAVFATPAGDTLEDGIVPDVRAVDLERTRRDEVLRAAERVLVEQLAA
jgi:carboxyl-terminal processing protease